MRILLAEDETLAGLAAEAILREDGHQVVLARDGAEALDLAGRRSFDLLVTDLNMPRLDGAALVRRLRARRPSLPVIAVTGYALSAEDRAALDGEGVLVVLRKPWSPEQMLAAVRRAAARPAASRPRGPKRPETRSGR